MGSGGELGRAAGTPAAAGAAVAPNRLLRALLVVLGAFDALLCAAVAVWARVAVRGGAQRAGGSNPAPPRALGVVVAEPEAANVSLGTVASVAAWCMACSDVEQLHLYDPSGHLKRCQALLAEALEAAAAREGRCVEVECGWGCPWPPCEPQQQPPQLRSPGSGARLQFAASGAAAGRPPHQRTWAEWLALQLGGVAKEEEEEEAGSQQQCLPLQQQEGEGERQQSDGEQEVQQQAQQGEQQQQQRLKRQCVGEHQPGQQQQESLCQQQRRGDQSAADEAAAGGTARHRGTGRSSGEAAASALGSHGPAAASYPRPAAVRVRLLSAEDAYAPVIAAALERCGGGSGPRGSSPRAIGRGEGAAPWQPWLGADGACGSACGCGCSGRGAQPQQDERRDSSAGGPCDTSKRQHGSADAKAAPCGCRQRLRQAAPQRRPDQRPRPPVAAAPPRPHEAGASAGSMLPELAALPGGGPGRDVLVEPQLLLVYGPALTLAGYPPFHARAAEVQHMGRLAAASRAGVAAAVAGYCRVLQRHGA